MRYKAVGRHDKQCRIVKSTRRRNKGWNARAPLCSTLNPFKIKFNYKFPPCPSVTVKNIEDYTTYQLYMRHEVGLVVEAPATVSTLVRLLSCMNQHVSVNVVFLCKSLLTHWAYKDFLIGWPPVFMHTLCVSNQSSECFESGLACIAQILASMQMHALQLEQSK